MAMQIEVDAKDGGSGGWKRTMLASVILTEEQEERAGGSGGGGRCVYAQSPQCVVDFIWIRVCEHKLCFPCDGTQKEDSRHVSINLESRKETETAILKRIIHVCSD